MKIAKRFMMLLMYFALAFFQSISVRAENVKENLVMSVYSPEYPDAYVVVERKSLKTYSTEEQLEEIEVTVFVEEKYDIHNGELIVTESRLLSEKEVKEIGEENFDNFERPIARNASNSKGKLTITCSGSYTTSGNSVTANLSGTAKWSGFYTISNPELEPASGDDYCGYAWAGGFDIRSSTASASTALGNLPVYAADSSPNAAKVWSFNESIYAGDSIYGMTNSNFKITLYKGNKTGNGNTASAIFKYIHTYQAHSGSISISASAGSIGTGFSLSGVSKQWSIDCTIHSIPY